MFLEVFIVPILFSTVNSEGLASTQVTKVSQVKPYVFPIPFELPSRNDRATQCWLRIEDVELIETIAIFCHIANEFLRNYIRDYNSRKMLEDDVDVSLWKEEPRRLESEILKPPDTLTSNGQKVKDWRVTTVLDPTTGIRIYVTQKADCHLIMYSKEGTTNYRVDCAKILYYVNYYMSSAVTPRGAISLIVMNIVIMFLRTFQ